MPLIHRPVVPNFHSSVVESIALSRSCSIDFITCKPSPSQGRHAASSMQVRRKRAEVRKVQIREYVVWKGRVEED